MKLNLGLASQMFRGIPLEDVVLKVCELGFDGIELEFGSSRLTVWDFEKAKKLKELADSKGLKITDFQPHTFFITPVLGPFQIPRQEQKELLNVEACCKMANEINVPYVRVQIIAYTYGVLPRIAPEDSFTSGGVQIPPTPLMSQYTQGLNTLKKAVKIAEDNGVTLGLDNHFFLTVMDHIEVVKMINSPNLKLFMDVANATLNGEDIVENAKACGDLLIHCHVKDRKVLGSQTSGTTFTHESVVPMGMGIVDWKAYIKALEEINYKGFLSIEGNAVGYTTEETAKIGLKYLRSLE